MVKKNIINVWNKTMEIYIKIHKNQIKKIRNKDINKLRIF